MHIYKIQIRRLFSQHIISQRKEAIHLTNEYKVKPLLCIEELDLEGLSMKQN